MRPLETPLIEIAKMIEYLVDVIEHELPVGDESDPAEASGAYYLRCNVRTAKVMAWQLRQASPPIGGEK